MKAQWDIAYKSAHVATDLTDRVAGGKKPDRELANWLWREARDLWKAAKKLKRFHGRRK